MRIEVNKECVIDDDNIAICREERLIAISITDKNRNEDDGFINYTLAIEDYQKCCENYDACYEIYSKNRFIKYIEHDCGITKDLVDFVLSKENDMSALFKDAEVLESSVVSVAYGENEEIIAIGICYNVHNGYYAHNIYADVNHNNIDVVYL